MASRIISSAEFSQIMSAGVDIGGVTYNRFTILDSELNTTSMQREVHPKDLGDAWKPRHSLWYACGNEWLEFITSEYISALKDSMWVYAIDVRQVHGKAELRSGKPAVLRLSTANQVRAFGRKYGSGSAVSMPGYGCSRVEAIDWDLVAQDYAGLEICPYQWECRHDEYWYYTWDVASGCVWDVRAIYDIHHIAVRAGSDEDREPLWRIA